MSGLRRSEAGRWFQQAEYDLKAVAWNLEGGFYDTAAFLSQQAAEKALKSLLYYQGSRRSALMTHSLVTMVNALERHLPSIASLRPDARELDLHYVPSRYPNGLPDGLPHNFYDRSLGEKAAASAGRIVTAVRDFYSDRQEMEIIQPD